MAFELPELPFAKDALDPHISARTLDFHHGKHHNAYVTKLNAMTEGTDKASKSLEDLIKSETGGLFNQAAQTWNHTFYWHSLSPSGGGEPTGPIADAIKSDLGGFAAFKEKFSAEAAGHFGSGWAWLVRNQSGKLEVVSTHDAGNPMTDGHTPILTCDVWEHAYYLDYQNARPKYIDAWWNLVNWEFANQNLG